MEAAVFGHRVEKARRLDRIEVYRTSTKVLGNPGNLRTGEMTVDALRAARNQSRRLSSLAPARDGLPLAGLIRRAAALATVLVVAAIAQPPLAARTILNVGMAAVDAALIEGDLAENWKSSPDGKQLSFSLRNGVPCHYVHGG